MVLSLFHNSNQLSFREHHTFGVEGGMEGRGDDQRREMARRDR